MTASCHESSCLLPVTVALCIYTVLCGPVLPALLQITELEQLLRTFLQQRREHNFCLIPEQSAAVVANDFNSTYITISMVSAESMA